jgi:putative salt-induced outer membrane protein YdiY
MKKTLLAATLISGLIVSGPAVAQWKGEAGVGLVNASGNTDNSSLSGTVGLSRQGELWKHNIFADIYKAQTDGVDSADRMMLGYKADRTLNERTYAWGALRMESDEFADIDRRLVGSIGLGYKVLLGPVHTLDVEAGLGYRITDFITATDKSKEAVGILAANYTGKLTDTVTLTQRLALEAGKDNKLLSSTTGLNVKLSSNLSLALAYILRRNSDIVGARGKKTDSLTTMNVVYSF